MKLVKSMRTGIVAAMALAIGVGAASAQAAPEAAHKGGEMRTHHMRGHGGAMMSRHILQQADTNGDRALTQEEVDKWRAELVTGADASGDGDISLSEFSDIYLQLMSKRMVDAFQNLDQDGDGAITPEETDARFGQLVERLDRNGDGQIDREDRPQRGGGERGQKRGG